MIQSSTTNGSLGSVEWRAQGRLAVVEIRHPGQLNAITVAMWAALRDCFSEIAARSDLRVVVIRGADGAFAAGADITEFAQHRATREQVRHYHLELIAPALRAIAYCPIPVVAAIDGPCVGGGLEIACVCDIRIASQRSTFGVPILKLGFPLAPFEAAGVVGLVGPAVAAELLLEGRIFHAQEALHKGVVQRVVEQADYEAEVLATLERIAAGAPLAARTNKRLIRLLSALDEGRALSPAQIESCWDFSETQDYMRGVTAFLNKTKPDFQDN
ncbi:MAG: putative enoyl-CoA hydratase echA8 [Pseudomonadota bacterium]